MRVVVVGLGIQGAKRRAVAGAAVASTVDPRVAKADYRDIRDVPLARFDAALLCIPDDDKIEIAGYLLANGKHVLVEKPLLAASDADLERLAALARDNGIVCYTAYNHRFEPHFVAMKEVLASGKLGQIYSLRMSYGNGTARLVRDSAWRDAGAGVLSDLGSHLLDTCLFWTGAMREDFAVVSANRFENRAFDHLTFVANARPTLQFEVTLLSWRNHFYADLYAEAGSAHIDSLCKWGPSRFTVRDRKLPSGRPDEQSAILVQPDPTWAAEYDHFVALCKDPAAGGYGNTANDIWLNRQLRRLSDQAMAEFPA
jgi:scyllo-inositol 2-dehydrogenase (NADP+)